MSALFSCRERLLILLLSLFLLIACETNTTGQLELGDEFPLSALLELTPDNTVEKIKGKTLIINFWASWCLPCRREMPALQELSDTLDNSRFMLIGISVDEDKHLMQEFLLQHSINFPNYLDTEQQLSQTLLNIDSYPETLIVSPQSRITQRINGEQNWNSQAIYSLLESGHDNRIQKLDNNRKHL